MNYGVRFFQPISLIQKIYPNQSHRKKLYQTSLPPRDGNTIIEILPQIMTHLKEAINFHVWSDEERLIHFNTSRFQVQSATPSPWVLASSKKTS